MQAIAVLLLIGAASYALLVKTGCLSTWIKTLLFARIVNSPRSQASGKSPNRRFNLVD